MAWERDGGDVARLAPTYLPREPHATVLYRLMKEHGAEFLRHARESYDGPLPRYVEDELRGYLRCGDFSRGFVHLRCHRCQHDLLVPFSCKNCGLCPSCAGRRMAAQAAHLVGERRDKMHLLDRQRVMIALGSHELTRGPAARRPH